VLDLLGEGFLGTQVGQGAATLAPLESDAVLISFGQSGRLRLLGSLRLALHPLGVARSTVYWHIVGSAGSEYVVPKTVQVVHGLGVDPGRREAGGRVEFNAEEVVGFALGLLLDRRMRPAARRSFFTGFLAVE